ncbi:MAG: DNA topoisomerase IB [Thermoanaerobaculia bacterium]|nr:DNA topoisomerase IB [Thermoanaerobaculia bacterium]
MARRVNRREKFEERGIRRRGSKESGFWYAWPDGTKVSDEDVLDRIRSLVIPPAWKEAKIAPTDRWALQAIGIDSKQRTQYLYHERYRRRREREKFLRIIRFAESLPKMRRRVGRDLDSSSLEKSSVMAAAVRLIDQGFFRLGNERSAEEEIYGLTTILPEHVVVRDDVVELEFVGKWGRKQKRAVRDAKVAALIRRLRRTGKGELFKYENGSRMIDVKDRHVNEYIQSVIGEDFSAKDFRTWAGSVIFATALGMLEETESEAKRKRQVTRAIKSTAEMLGNTPAVCRSSYICPVLVDAYMEGRSFEAMKNPWSKKVVAKTRLSVQEKKLIEFLRDALD